MSGAAADGPAAPFRARLWGRVGVTGLVLAAILLAALALRLRGITAGLPYNFVNPDEGTVAFRAAYVARGHLDPQFFYYPSLFFYLLAGVYVVASPVLALLHHPSLLHLSSYVVDKGPYFLLGRLLSLFFGMLAVYLVYRLGRLAYGVWAGLLAAAFLAVVPLHVAYSRLAVTDVTAGTLSLLALLLLLYAARGRGRWWLVAGALVAGLATSTKYNLGLLLLPATLAAVYACRGEVAARLGGRARGTGGAAWLWLRLVALRVWLPMLAAFLLGSPFIVLDPVHFASDFYRQNRIMQRGWLGFEHTGNGFFYNVHVNLTGALGIVLLVLALAGLAWALYRHRDLDVLVAPYAIVYFLYVSTWKELADRYMLPILPLLVLLAARLCVDALRVAPHRRRAWAVTAAAVIVIAAALGLPLMSSLSAGAQIVRADTRTRALAWVEANVPVGSLVAVDSYGPPLVRRADLPSFRQAGLEPAAYVVRKLPVPVPGEETRLPYPAAVLVDHPVRYGPPHDASYVIVSSAIYDRVLAAAADYPVMAAFYRHLAASGPPVAEFHPRPGERGPTIKVYKL